jgi:dCMP deaminase
MSDELRAANTPSLSDSDMLDQLESLTQSWPQRPSWDTYFMATALLMASRSSCERLQVGCVIVSSGEQKNRIIAAGYNGFLPGAPHRSRVRDGHEQATVHAEQNAICDAARRGVSLEGATVYITHFPCINCAKILSAAGIRCIKYHSDYRNDELVEEILAESHVALLKL